MPIDSSIRNIIKAEGYITIDEMMRQVLSANSHSYYRSTADIGARGDFITAPEISQLFGETIGFWLTMQWHKMGCPKEIAILEAGPGQGILMRDLLRVARITPDLFSAIRIYLHEINPFFIQKQKDILTPFGREIHWITKISDLPKLPVIFIANEFFDALPIRQFIKLKDLWYERILKISPIDSRIKADKIRARKELQNQLLSDHPNAYDGAVVEESIESMETARLIAAHIKENRGSGIIIDYGYDIEPRKRSRTQYNATLQAIKNHQYAPIIDTIGEADLSAHVDFQALKRSILEQKILGASIMSQAEFLKNYGIMERLQKLQEQSPEFSEVLERQAERLTSAKQMGNLFKALEFFSVSLSPP